MSYINSDAGADTLNDIGHGNMHSGKEHGPKTKI